MHLQDLVLLVLLNSYANNINCFVIGAPHGAKSTGTNGNETHSLGSNEGYISRLKAASMHFNEKFAVQNDHPEPDSKNESNNSEYGNLTKPSFSLVHGDNRNEPVLNSKVIVGQNDVPIKSRSRKILGSHGDKLDLNNAPPGNINEKQTEVESSILKETERNRDVPINMNVHDGNLYNDNSTKDKNLNANVLASNKNINISKRMSTNSSQDSSYDHVAKAGFHTWEIFGFLSLPITIGVIYSIISIYRKKRNCSPLPKRVRITQSELELTPFAHDEYNNFLNKEM